MGCPFLLFFTISLVISQKPAAPKIDFSADVKNLMKLIINSLYSNKEIFLRELISNGADALNKVRLQNQTNSSILGEGDNQKLEIHVIPDEDLDEITIWDRGIGMSRDELIKNLGTIAHSGTKKFLEGVKANKSEQELIGQFGVGFYSAFLVSDKVTVISKRIGEKQYRWESLDAGSFRVTEDTSEDLGRGTKVILKLKDIRYANTTIVRHLLEKYSQYIEFPLLLRTERADYIPPEKPIARLKQGEKKGSADLEIERDSEDEPIEKEKFDTSDNERYELVQVNLQPPLWLRNPDEVENVEEYSTFWHSMVLNYYREPCAYTHFHQKTDVSFKGLIYIPPLVPRYHYRGNEDQYTRLRLYIKKVYVTEEFRWLLPQYLTFVRGIIDVDDDNAEINVSRELLQDSNLMKMVARKLQRRIIQMITDISEKARAVDADESDVENYSHFYGQFGRDIRRGCFHEMVNTDKRKFEVEGTEFLPKLQKLLRFNTTFYPDQLVALDDYVDRMEKRNENKQKKRDEDEKRLEEANEKKWKEENVTEEKLKSLREEEAKKRAERDRSFRVQKENDILYMAVDTNDYEAGFNAMKKSPFLQPFIQKKQEVLLLYDPWDEALLLRFRAYRGHPIRSTTDALKSVSNLDFVQRKVEAWKHEYSELITWIKETLHDKIERVEISTKLIGDISDLEEEDAFSTAGDTPSPPPTAAPVTGSGAKGAGAGVVGKKKKKVRVKGGGAEDNTFSSFSATLNANPFSKPVASSGHDIRRRIPVAIVKAEGAFSSGMQRIFDDHQEMTPEIRARVKKKVFEINPLNKLIKRMNKALLVLKEKEKAYGEKKMDAERKRLLELYMKNSTATATNATNATTSGPPPPANTSANVTPNNNNTTTTTNTTATANTTTTPTSGGSSTDEVPTPAPGVVSLEEEEETVNSQRHAMTSLLTCLYQAALMNSGYLIDDVLLFADTLFEVMTNLTGLPYAPVFVDEANVDFDAYRERELKAEREIKEEEKRLMEEREAIVKKAREEGKEDDLDPALLARYKRDQIIKARKEKNKKEKAKKKKQESKKKKKEDDDTEEEDKEDKEKRELLERRRQRKDIRRKERAKRGLDDDVPNEDDEE